MAITDNNGTFYFAIPCGVPSQIGIDLQANNGSGYYYLSANDFILWGQSTRYNHVSSNNGTTYYFYQCNVPSTPGFDFTSNNGTGFYYSSSFNCVKFCGLTLGGDDPANAAEPDATAWVLMDGPWYNTPGDPSSGFIGGQSWRKMAPIGYAPYGNETYEYGDEVVRYETGVWLYLNSTLGEIARAYSYEGRPWLVTTWNNNFTAAKIIPSYSKMTNYPDVP